MSRSATDATRFTSTTPHASSKAPNMTRIAPKGTSPKKSGPLGESPQEKVRRLRAAADRARNAQVSSFDKMLVKGRVWADRAHRFTALSLIGITVVAAGITVYALGDMMIYNRKKRAQFYEEQKARHASAIHTAKYAIANGIATPEQIAFIRREEDHDAELAAFAKAKKESGVFRKTKNWLFSGLKNEEEGEDAGSSERRLGYEGMSEEDDSMGERESDIVRALEDKKMAITEKAKQAFAAEKERERTGGPLDRIGTNAAQPQDRWADEDDDEKPKGGWTSFFIRK